MIENIKLNGSKEYFGDTRTGEINAASKNELAKKVLASLNSNINASATAKRQDVQEKVVAAFKDTTSNDFHKIGAALAGQLYEVASREGFARRFLQKVETQQGADIRLDVKFPNSIAMTAVSAQQVQPVYLRDKHYYPALVDIAFNCMIKKEEINRTTGDILNEKLQEGLASVEVQEDRLWKKSTDMLAGVANPENLLTSGLTPDALAIMRNEVNRWNLPTATLLAASDVMNDLIGLNFSTWFDPVTQYELVQTGAMGSLLGMNIITDAYRAPTLKVLDQGDVYVLSSPEYHGAIADRGPVESTEINGAIQGVNARGWYMVESIAMLVHNARSIAKGTRVISDV